MGVLTWPLNPQKRQKTKKITRKKKQKNTKIPKRVFQLSIKFSCFGGCPKFPFFLTTWPKKRAPKRDNKNRGFGKAFFDKQMCVTKQPFLDKNNQKFQLSFFCLIFCFSTTRKTKIGWNPHFDCVLANLEKEILKTNFCTLSLKKAIFRKLADNWAQKAHKMITEQKKIAWNHYKYRSKITSAQIMPLHLPQIMTFKKAKLGPGYLFHSVYI